MTTPHEEIQYLDLIREIFAHGERRPDRYVADLTYSEEITDKDQNRHRNTIHLRATAIQVLTER